MNKIIPFTQFAFIQGRFIQDNTLLTQELLSKLHKAKASNALMALKIDLSKAYDHINRYCIIEVMRKIGSSHKCCDLILACLFNISISIIINGRACRKFYLVAGFAKEILYRYIFSSLA